MDRSKWEYKPFEECIEKSKKTKQLMTSDYQPDGAYPIISQEASLISGYTNDPDYVNHFDRPVVIFGDHTRVLKYVDFDFAVGADGVKILIPHANLDAKFLLSFLTWYKIPNLGYSRHYKLLKDISVPVPPIADQQRIVAELDCLNEMIAVKQEQLKEFDKLAQSIFYDMFGDPHVNNFGWKIVLLAENVIDSQIGIIRGAKEQGLDKKYIYFKMNNITNSGQMDLSNYTKVDATGDDVKKYQLKYGDFLFNTRNSYELVGKSCVYTLKEGPLTLYNNNILRLNFNSNLDSIFLSYLFNDKYMKEQLNTIKKGTTNVCAIYYKDLSRLRIMLPDCSLQQQFAEKISAIEAQKELVKQSIAETQVLLDYTMDKYFG
ncbi:MAG: restriction endonuclease subunit S [Prevotella sp.]|nr:restriction endonuclease subunit S [Prevotella sp.]